MKLEHHLKDYKKEYRVFGNQINVYGNISLSHLYYTIELPEALYTYALDLEDQKIYRLPTELYVLKSLHISKTIIRSIPLGTWIGEYIYTSRTTLRHLDNLYVNGYFTTRGVLS